MLFTPLSRTMVTTCSSARRWWASGTSLEVLGRSSEAKAFRRTLRTALAMRATSRLSSLPRDSSQWYGYTEVSHRFENQIYFQGMKEGMWGRKRNTLIALLLYCIFLLSPLTVSHFSHPSPGRRCSFRLQLPSTRCLVWLRRPSKEVRPSWFQHLTCIVVRTHQPTTTLLQGLAQRSPLQLYRQRWRSKRGVEKCGSRKFAEPNHSNHQHHMAMRESK